MLRRVVLIATNLRFEWNIIIKFEAFKSLSELNSVKLKYVKLIKCMP